MFDLKNYNWYNSYKDFGEGNMKKLLLCLMFLLTGFLFGCTNSSSVNYEYYYVSFDVSINIVPTIPSIEVKKGESIDEPTILSSTTYKEREIVFEGWYLYGEPFNFNSKITKDITLIARWKTIDTYSASLIDLLSSNTISNYRYYIARITHRVDTSFNVHAAFEVATKFGIEEHAYIKGNSSRGYIWIIGGEIETNIYKHFDLYPFSVKIGSYHLICERDTNYSEEDGIPRGLGIYGYSVIVLESFDPLKSIDEQDQGTLAILQPFINAINFYNNSLGS